MNSQLIVVPFVPQLAGVDEVGRGCLAGPVVGAAVSFCSEAGVSEFRDSKLLSEARREKLYDLIQSNHQWAVGIASVEEIERFNILWASQLAMVRALEQLHQKVKGLERVYVDGHLKLRDWKACEQVPVVSGDKLVKQIAAASIMAKVTRDRMMLELDREFPQYGFAKNKGYGVETHRQALEKFGPTLHHRRLFKGVGPASSIEV